MFLGIDHLVIAVADPDGAAAVLLDSLGLEATSGGRHDALGTSNRLIWFGDSSVEVIGVFDRALAEASWIGTPTLQALDAGGGFVTWAIATDDLERDIASLRALGADVSDPIDGERRRPDGAIVRWRLAKPRGLGPADPPFLIEHDTSAAEWSPADRASRAAQRHPASGPVRLQTLELPVDDVNATIQRFARMPGLRFRPSLAGGGSRDATLGSQTVRLRPSRGGSTMVAIHLSVDGIGEPRAAELLGCRWVLRPSA